MYPGNRGSGVRLVKKPPKIGHFPHFTPSFPASPVSRGSIPPVSHVSRAEHPHEAAKQGKQEAKETQGSTYRIDLKDQDQGTAPQTPQDPYSPDPAIKLGDPLIPGYPGGTGWFGERYLLVPGLRGVFRYRFPGSLPRGTHRMSPSSAWRAGFRLAPYLPGSTSEEGRVA